jgi:hypothetical protein
MQNGHMLVTLMTGVPQVSMLSRNDTLCEGLNLRVVEKCNGGAFLNIIMTITWVLSKNCEIIKSG